MRRIVLCVLAGALVPAAVAGAKPRLEGSPVIPRAHLLAGVRLDDCNRTVH